MNKYNQIGRLDDSLVKVAQDKYNESKNKSVTQARQKVDGRAYPGKNQKMVDFQTIAKGVALSILVVGLGYVAVQGNNLMEYDAAVNRTLNDELSTSEHHDFKNYQNITKGNIIDQISDRMDVLSQIGEERKELAATGDYEWGVLNSEITSDAIQNVAEENTLASIEEMREYTNGGHGYGK